MESFVAMYRKDREDTQERIRDREADNQERIRDREAEKQEREADRQERIRDRDYMRREFNNIRLSSPDQALHRGARSSLSQLSSADQVKAVANGTFATWSYVRRLQEQKVYAVGCAHCAFYYCTRSMEHSFVSLPQSGGISCVYVFEELLMVQNPLRTALDFVAVELNEIPDGMKLDELPIWTDERPHLASLSAVVGGYSHAGNVLGNHLRGVGDVTVFTAHLDALMVHSSGALMYGFDQDCNPHVLGVYCGDVDANSKLRPRGRICPMPPLASLTRLETTSAAMPLTVSDAMGDRPCQFDGMNLVDGSSRWPGVLTVGNISHYVGAGDVGRSRAV